MYNSNKVKYMIRGLAYLAIHGKDKRIAIKDIANSQEISIRYLEQAFSVLKKSGLVTSEKGPKGGYSLNCSLDTDLYEILEAVMPYESAEELSNNTLVDSINNVLWKTYDQGIISGLKSVALKDIVEEYERLNQKDNYMYYI